MPGVALTNPTTDPILLASAATGVPCQIMARASGTGSPAAANWVALQWTAGALQEVPLASTALIDLGPMLASAGFYPASPPASPASPADVTWTRLTNVTGLVTGVTTLEVELLLYTMDDLAGSGVIPYLHYVWDGTTFRAP